MKWRIYFWMIAAGCLAPACILIMQTRYEAGVAEARLAATADAIRTTQRELDNLNVPMTDTASGTFTLPGKSGVPGQVLRSGPSGTLTWTYPEIQGKIQATTQVQGYAMAPRQVPLMNWPSFIPAILLLTFLGACAVVVLILRIPKRKVEVEAREPHRVTVQDIIDGNPLDSGVGSDIWNAIHGVQLAANASDLRGFELRPKGGR